ncbi:MAG: GerMN domain-containing protein [Eubacteriales bacterium]
MKNIRRDLFVCVAGCSCFFTGCQQIADDTASSIGVTVEKHLQELQTEVGHIVKEAATEVVKEGIENVTSEVSNFAGKVQESVDSSGQESVEEEMDLEEDVVQIVVFYPDEGVEYFLEEKVSIETTGNWVTDVIKSLIKKGILPEEVIVEAYEIEGEQLTIVLSEEFEMFLNQFGTSGEYMVLGSIVNTLLYAGQLKEVMILIEDGYLETGHAIYDYPWERFEDLVTR